MVTDYYKPNPDRLRDWISTPKANGYESLHTTVMSPTGKWVEVQIRSKRMDEIAEKGFAAHWKYKETGVESALDEWIRKIRELLENPDSNALDFIDDFKLNLFSDEIFVFTPTGELRTLPANSTTLDFAFDIHTQVGSKCIGAKVNNKLVPINYVLKNGDQIEILTSQKQKPHEDWLRFVVSSKAKARIKDELKEDKKKVAEDGKEIIFRKVRQMKEDPSQQILEQMRDYFKAPTHFDLYFRVGAGCITTADIKRFLENKPTSPIRSRPNIPIADARPVEQEINKIGLTLINVNIRDITDESGYIEAIGKRAAAEAINRAKVEVAQQERDGAMGEAMVMARIAIPSGHTLVHQRIAAAGDVS